MRPLHTTDGPRGARAGERLGLRVNAFPLLAVHSAGLGVHPLAVRHNPRRQIFPLGNPEQTALRHEPHALIGHGAKLHQRFAHGCILRTGERVFKQGPGLALLRLLSVNVSGFRSWWSRGAGHGRTPGMSDKCTAGFGTRESAGRGEEVHRIAAAATSETIPRVQTVRAREDGTGLGAVFVERAAAGLRRLALESEVPPEVVNGEPLLGFGEVHCLPSASAFARASQAATKSRIEPRWKRRTPFTCPGSRMDTLRIFPSPANS